MNSFVPYFQALPAPLPFHPNSSSRLPQVRKALQFPITAYCTYDYHVHNVAALDLARHIRTSILITPNIEDFLWGPTEAITISRKYGPDFPHLGCHLNLKSPAPHRLSRFELRLAII